MLPFISGDGVGNTTIADTSRIRVALGGGVGFSHIICMSYLDGGTAHTLTLMRGASRSKITGAVAAGATVVTSVDALVDGAGGAIAANDVIAIQLDNGTWQLNVVSSVDVTTKIITLTTAITTGRSVLDGAKIVEYGVAGDAMHATQQYLSGAGSSQVNFPVVAGVSMCKATGTKEPIVFDSNNATNAGTLVYAQVGETFS